MIHLMKVEKTGMLFRFYFVFSAYSDLKSEHEEYLRISEEQRSERGSPNSFLLKDNLLWFCLQAVAALIFII